MHVFERNKNYSILRHENIAKSALKLSSLKETRDNLIAFQRDLPTTMDWLQMAGIWAQLSFLMRELKFF